MQAIKCELCGSNQLIKKDDFFQCEYCGTKYSLEEAKRLMISGTVEFITGDAEKERLLNNAKTYIQIKEFEKAISVYDDVTQQFPDDSRGWWGKLTTIIELYFYNGQFNYFNIINKLYENAYALSEDKEYINSYLDNLISRYGECVHTTKTNQMSYYDGNLNEHCGVLNCIDSFSCWLIYGAYRIFSILPDNFKIFVYQINNNYIFHLSSGNICPEFPNSINVRQKPPLYTGEWLIDKKYYDRDIATILCYRFGYEIKYDYRYNADDSKYIDSISIKHKRNIINRVKCLSICVVGRWTLIYTYSSWKWFYLPGTLTQKDIYKSLHLCQYCGGRFKGVFKITCSNCGKPKDY